MSLTYLPFVFPAVPSVGTAFCLRTAGNISLEIGDNPEDVRRNRHALKQQLGLGSWQEVQQVHGPQMVFDPEPGDIAAPGSIQADGLATEREGRALVIKTADCQPVLLAHKSGQYIAALHAGWRGNVLHFPATGVRDFCEEYNLSPADVYAVRGPSLGPDASEFKNFHEEFGIAFEQWYNAQTQTVNLWAMTHDQLMGAGIPAANIFSIDLCTHLAEDMFFSYRRNNNCGRQASIIWIK